LPTLNPKLNLNPNFGKLGFSESGFGESGRHKSTPPTIINNPYQLNKHVKQSGEFSS